MQTGKRKRRARGEGTLYYRKSDKRWVAAVVVRGKRLQFYGRNAKEAADRLRIDRNRADRVPANRVILNDWTDLWLSEAVRDGVYKPSTAALYRGTLSKHVADRLGLWKLGKIESQDVRELLADLERDNVSATVRARVHMVLKACWAEAFMREMVPGNIVERVRAPKATKGRRRAVDLDVAIAFIKAAHGDTNEALYLLLLCNGLRRGEGFGLYPKDIDCDAGLIRVERQLLEGEGGLYEGPPKGGKAVTLPLAPFVIPALRRHLAARALNPPKVPYLFTSPGRWPSSDRCGLRGSVFLRKVWHPFLKAHDLPPFVPHQLRHTTGTLLKYLGVPVETVRDILRHAAIATTAEIYQDEIPAHMRDALSKLSGLFREGDPAV